MSGMKRILNGVRYDTEKAIAIGRSSNDNRCSRSDFAYWQATLYKTPRSGRYFLAGEGGARSIFAQSVGQNAWSGGEGIIPFEDEAAAFAWAQEELSAEEVEEHFGHLIEDA